MVIERMICLSNGSTAQPVVMRQNDYNTAEIRLLVYETPNHLLDMTGMAAVVSYEVDGVPTDPYEATVEESHCLRFVVPGEVTETHGNGRMQIGIYLENSLTHSYMLPYEVEYSLPMPGPGTEADPAPAFFSLVKEARETMANVKDGGYYTPNVDETGNLSWVGSDSDMPGLPTANIMGPKGDDGQKGDAGSTPIINASGNWEISGVDTGVKADWRAEQTNAATSAAAAAKSAENAAASANDAAKSAEEAAASLGELNAKKEAAIDEIQTAGDSTLASIPQDYTSLVNDVAGMANAIVIDDLDPANMVHVTNAAARPAVELISYIEPYQEGSGDPSLTNVRTISGWNSVEAPRTGKNILSKKNMPTLPYSSNGITFTDAGDGKILANGTATADAILTFHSVGRGKRTPIKAGVFTFSATFSGSGARVLFFVNETQDSSTNLFTGTLTNTTTEKTVSIEADAFFGMYLLVPNGTTVTNCIIAPMLEVGSTATDYEPYQTEIETTDLPETVYGGFRNLRTGVLTVDRKKALIQEATTLYTSVADGFTGGRIIQRDMLVDSRSNGVCDKLPSKNSPANASDSLIVFGAGNNTIYFVLPTNLVGTTLETMNAYLAENPLTVVYPLAEPYTIQLSPQQLNLLKGINNVWSNCGKTKLVYIADTKKYIDEKIAALAAAQLGV